MSTRYPYYYYFHSLRVFHISVSWGSFTGVWETTNLLKSPELYSVFCPFSAMLYFDDLHSSSYFQVLHPFTNPLVTVPRAPVTIGIISFIFHSFFFQFSCKVEELILLFAFFQLYSVVNRDSKVHNSASSFLFLWGLVVCPKLGDLFVSQNPKLVWASYSPGQILDCAYTICSFVT